MIRFLLLIVLFIITQGFFDLVNNPLVLFSIEEQDAVLVFSALVLLMQLFKIPFRKLGNYRIYLFLFFYCFISNLVMGYLNIDQPLVFNLLTGRLYITYFFILLALITLFNIADINLDRVNKFFVVISAFLILLNIYVYFSQNYGIINGLVIVERFESARFLIGGLCVINLTIYFYENFFYSRINSLAFFGLLIVLFSVSKSRGIVNPILLIIMQDLFFNKNVLKGKILYKVTLSLFLAVFILWNPSEIFNTVGNIVSLTHKEITENSGNFGFRVQEFSYYLGKLDLKSAVFGYGMENKKFSEILSYNNFFLSDLGLFRIFFTSGLIGLSIFIYSLYSLFKEARAGDTVLHKFVIGFVLFQLFSFPTMTFFYYSGGVFIFLFIIVSLKQLNMSQQ